MPSIQQMRSELYLKYKGRTWKQKVLAMAEDQVVAIWYSLQKQKKKRKKEKEATQLKLFKDI